MKICITRTLVNPYSATFIKNQIRELSLLAEVHTVHTGRLPEKMESGELLNPLPYWIIQKIIKGLTGIRNNYFSHFGFKRFLRKNQVDVVLANYGTSGVYIYPVCRALGIPMVIHFHGYDVTYQDVLKKYGDAYKKILPYVKCVAVSEDMKSRLILLGAPEQNIALIPYGIDLSKFHPLNRNGKSSLFLAVGRFTAKKAPMHSIDAFALVRKKHPGARLVMVGGMTDLFQECKKLVHKLGLNNSVTFTGVLEPDEIISYMQSANVFIQHSVVASSGDMEGTPNTILEAAACGLPVVSTRHGGIKEAVVHGVTGYLVNEHDVEEMASYMMKLIENSEDATAMGLNGRKHIEQNYDLKNQSRKLFEVLKECIN